MSQGLIEGKSAWIGEVKKLFLKEFGSSEVRNEKKNLN